jgi:hypothetical protein
LVKRRRKPLRVGFDGTEVRGFCTRMAAAVLKGRAVPLVWASYPKGVRYKSPNNLEGGLLRVRRTMIPEKVPVIVLADRGFGRTELARTCQCSSFHYVVRIRPDVWIEHPDFRGKLPDYPVSKGLCPLLANVQYPKQRPVRQHVVVRGRLGLPAKRDEPWFLMTDLRRPALALSELYARRMTVEERFRDDKHRRNSYALRATQLTRADRIDRLLLILALAYLLLVGLGWLARRRYRPGLWCGTNRPTQCSVFTIGRVLSTRLRVSAAAAFAGVLMNSEPVAPKSG